jgi:hypothetical protein
MTLTIGRCGLDVTHDEVQSLDDTGTNVRISGWLRASTLADAKVLRQQLLGHVNNPDEPVVPVTWSTDSTLDGFYRVTNASVGMQHEQRNIDNLIFPFSVELERMANTNSAAAFESSVDMAYKTNAYSSAGSSHNCPGLPSPLGTGAYRDGNTWSLFSSASFTPDSGTWRNADFASASLPKSIVTLSETTPADYYDCSVKLTTGSSDRVVVGRRIDQDSTNLRIDNGLMRLKVTSWTGPVFSCQWYYSGAWSTAKTFQFSSSSITAYAVTCMRNAPERVSIRLLAPNAKYIDISMRRGAPYAEIVLTDLTGSSITQTFGPVSSEAATSYTQNGTTAGHMATSASPANIKYFLHSVNAAPTLTGASGLMAVSAFAGGRWEFAVGAQVGSPSGGSIGDGAVLGASSTVAISERQRLVVR